MPFPTSLNNTYNPINPYNTAMSSLVTPQIHLPGQQASYTPLFIILSILCVISTIILIAWFFTGNGIAGIFFTISFVLFMCSLMFYAYENRNGQISS